MLKPFARNGNWMRERWRGAKKGRARGGQYWTIPLAVDRFANLIIKNHGTNLAIEILKKIRSFL